MLGARYTPLEFAHSVCAPDEYIALTSTDDHPYYKEVVLDVPDNWEHNKFLNIPKDSLLTHVERAIRHRHAVCWEGDTHEEPSPEGVVTVRHAGQSMTIVIRDGTRLRDGMEGGGGITLPQLPTEAAARIFPALYSEYMSPDTSASRKYEIIDLVYGLGYTLPAIPGLHEQYMKEVRESSGKKGGKSPVNLSERAGRPIKRLHIDRSVSPSDVPDMGASPSDQPQNE